MANLDSAYWKTPMCGLLEQSGQPVAFDSILRFLLDDTCKCFPFQAPLNCIHKFWILFSFIVTLFRKGFRAISSLAHLIIILSLISRYWYRKLLPIITPVVYVLRGAASQIHTRVSSSENYDMLSNATGYPNCSKNPHMGVFQYAESKFAVRFALWPLQQYKL